MEKYEEHLKDSLSIKVTRPVIGVENNERLDPVFFRQFLSRYKLLERNKTNFTALVLSGLFLHLTLESYITWIIRWLLRNVNRGKNRRVLKLWENHFEDNASLNEKAQFFADIFLTDSDMQKVRKIKKFVNELAVLRNKIVHGHEYSITRWSNRKPEKTKLAELLTFKRINDYYKGFIDCMHLISILLEKVDMEDITSGISSKEWITNYLKFKFKGRSIS